MHKNSVTFTCWEKEDQIEIQLEPEALIFKVLPGNEIRFEGSCLVQDFKWAIRVEHSTKGIQLMPDIVGPFDIQIFENGILLEDWYKYM